jgi:hypothetical protein
MAPANDDSRKNTAGLLRALESRSSRGAIRNAALLSLLWAVGVLGLANLLYAPAIWQIRSVSDLLAMPAAIGFLVAIIIPILVFFAFSIMMARAREMRSAARSMAEVALRLAEPENIAGDRILTVGQAVRREVSAMNEGIERTIARASELETLVHSEVNALERSYSDNEMRVRSLVQELGSERDAIVSHAERIRASIAGAHEQLKEELTTASEESPPGSRHPERPSPSSWKPAPPHCRSGPPRPAASWSNCSTAAPKRSSPRSRLNGIIEYIDHEI